MSLRSDFARCKSSKNCTLGQCGAQWGVWRPSSLHLSQPFTCYLPLPFLIISSSSSHPPRSPTLFCSLFLSSSLSLLPKMSSAVVAGSSSSCSATFSTTRNHHSLPALPQTLPSSLGQIKTTFQGLTLQNAKRSVRESFKSEIGATHLSSYRRGLEITAKTAGASKTIEVEVDKPLGLTLGQKSNGVVIITAVDGGGNAAKAGLKSGDQVIYTSSFFGDELWPADKLGFTKTAIQAKAESVYFVVSRGAEVDVKRLPKRPHPPRFGRKLTDAQKAKATHICIDCGYIYILSKPFEEQPDDYTCPQCRAPKKRFARYDPNTGKAIGGGLPPISVIVGLLVGVGAVGALLVYGLQ